jgi:hemerythrin-like domain-containing protein
MSTNQEANVAASFFNIHDIITRALRVSLESTQGILQHGFRLEMTREGFFNYIRCLSTVMNAHHLTEDNIAFPYFRDKLPDVAFDSWTYWHGKMDEILNEINLAVKKSDEKDELETELKVIENALARLNDWWPGHIGPETDEFITKADALIPVEEQLRLVRLFAEYLLKHTEPLNLTVPFMLYNLSLKDRQTFSQWIPAEGILDLVPVAWKGKWASMTPLMLA